MDDEDTGGLMAFFDIVTGIGALVVYSVLFVVTHVRAWFE